MNILITLPIKVNIRSATVSTDNSDNVYLTAVDESFLFYKFDSALTVIAKKIFKGTNANAAHNGRFSAIA